MKTLIKETVIYQALDGKEFVDKNECAKYDLILTFLIVTREFIVSQHIR